MIRTVILAIGMVASFLLMVSSVQGQTKSQPVMQTFPLKNVQLDKGVFYDAQQTDLRYILALDVDRLLVPFRREAGIPTDALSYGNWENTGLDGHIGGHYLSAMSLMYAATGSSELKVRLDYMVNALAQCQKKNNNGYVGGIPGGQAMWQEIKNGNIDADNFSLNKKWVPLYNIHKLFAGLRDAYQVTGDEQAKIVFIRLCDWFVDLTASLSDTQIQQMLRSEHGGMNEVFADAAEITGDQKYLVLARKLSHRAILDPLLTKTDKLTGLHANTQIPKVIGYKKIADVSHDTAWSQAAAFFWQTVTDRRSVSIGGNSVREHFHPANDFSSMIESNQGPETCNTYNMLRLTRSLYQTDPSVHYIDYYERALYNHILSSQHPGTGGFVYFTPMRPRHYRVYSDVNESFWCCVGSGIENHGKYGELIYTHTGDDVYVNLFIPSTLTWNEKKLTLTQRTNFPYEDKTTLTLKLSKSRTFSLNVRYPEWVKEGGLTVTVNGEEERIRATPGTYVPLHRKWKNGDVITVHVPMHTRVEYLPDSTSWGTFVHGPIVLAAATDDTDLAGLKADGSRMGHVAEGKFYPIDEAPAIVKDNENFVASLRPIAGKPLTFSAESLIYQQQYKSLTLVPFFSLHDKRYMIYWQMASAVQLDSLTRKLHEKEKALQLIKSRTVDEVTAGEQQPEVEHGYKGEQSEAGSTNGKSWRASRNWFSYELQNKSHEGHILRVAYAGQGHNRAFDLLVNGQHFKTVIPVNREDEDVLFEEYPLPETATKTTASLVITFKAHQQSGTGRIYGVQLLKP